MLLVKQPKTAGFCHFQGMNILYPGTECVTLYAHGMCPMHFWAHASDLLGGFMPSSNASSNVCVQVKLVLILMHQMCSQYS